MKPQHGCLGGLNRMIQRRHLPAKAAETEDEADELSKPPGNVTNERADPAVGNRNVRKVVSRKEGILARRHSRTQPRFTQIAQRMRMDLHQLQRTTPMEARFNSTI